MTDTSPKAQSQKAAILAHLRKHGQIDMPTAWKEYGCAALRSRISDLRKEGHEIESKMQLFQDRLAMPFGEFHEAMESVLGRAVYTHEFANRDSLQKEFLGEIAPPTFEEIIEKIPAEKRMIIFADSEN